MLRLTHVEDVPGQPMAHRLTVYEIPDDVAERYVVSERVDIRPLIASATMAVHFRNPMGNRS